VTLLRRSSRPVYRLYSEEEFLAAADWSGEIATEEWALDAPAGTEPSTWGRVAGVAALTGALAVVAGVVVVSASRSPAGRRSVHGLSADNRPPSSAPSPPAFSRPPSRNWRRHRRAPRGPAAPRRPTEQRGGVREVAQASAPAVVVTSETPPPTAVPEHAVDAASSAVPVSGARSEFGFER
jgi:hypothetical protein